MVVLAAVLGFVTAIAFILVTGVLETQAQAVSVGAIIDMRLQPVAAQTPGSPWLQALALAVVAAVVAHLLLGSRQWRGARRVALWVFVLALLACVGVALVLTQMPYEGAIGSDLALIWSLGQAGALSPATWAVGGISVVGAVRTLSKRGVEQGRS